MKVVLGLIFALVFAAYAEDSLTIRTNYYAVSGATFRELRADIAERRPWTGDHDGYTSWKIDWTFTTSSSDAGCSVQSFQTKTAITITLPRWSPPSDADADLKENWNKYLQSLLAHEDGHKRIALAAASEIRKKVNALRSSSTAVPSPGGAGQGEGGLAGLSCAALQDALNRIGNNIINDFNQRETAYDIRTGHGRNS